MDSDHRIDALLPREIALKAEAIGVQKTRLDFLSLVALAVLAGAFIGLGAMFATTVLAGAEGVLPFGVSRLLPGVVFRLGLILVVGWRRRTVHRQQSDGNGLGGGQGQPA